MKAHAEQIFKAEILDLSQEEAELILVAVGLLSGLDSASAEEAEINKKTCQLAGKMLPQLRDAFRESNWRE